jgi:hypothetical protein
MFNIAGFAISLAEVIGLIVTIVGIWLVVRQLREAKLDSQMGGMMDLRQMISDNTEFEQLLSELIAEDDWESLNAEEAHSHIFDSDEHTEAWNELTSFFELYSLLVRKKALDEGMAYAYNGKFVSLWWKRLEKIARQQRIELKWDDLLENWEWLAARFEKKST